MKPFFLSIICLLLAFNCKSDQQKVPKQYDTETSLVEKIANAHGYKNWKNVSEIKFTFQVDRDTLKGNGRSWSWFPKKDKIKMTTGKTSVEYIRSKMDSSHVRADRGFINDKFWLLIPFQLVWDNSAEVSEPIFTVSPINKKQLNMITLTYPNEGGYTPGDAYDIFYDNDFIIREWVFRKGNAKEPSLTTTFENYQTYNGIKIATDHKKADGNWNLNFTDVSITLDK
ncbi:hypothetical protein HNV10_07870 [Winogradskyella litoriviva]|uniref:Outer membrane lipoprotein-sorting protein n=1 Tax=Winogradskyella litoriviva TaxID=1220182 RepID=A0ABX2E4Z8_9FLAO|nr:hypothetical protein [Winogradskyella litoriviva]NRD23153.1 hypothetical protein [Winogradskyella litoriviva]